MEQIEQRLAALERAMVRWRRIAVAVGAVCLLALFAGADGVRKDLFAKEIVAQSLHLVNAEGERYAYVGLVDGQPRVSLQNAERQTVFTLDVPKGLPVVRLYDGEVERFALGLHGDTSTLRLADPKQRTSFSIDTLPHKTVVWVRGANGGLKELDLP